MILFPFLDVQYINQIKFYDTINCSTDLQADRDDTNAEKNGLAKWKFFFALIENVCV